MVVGGRFGWNVFVDVLLDRFRLLAHHSILVMEEILHHLACINPVNNGINYQPQLGSWIVDINSIISPQIRNHRSTNKPPLGEGYRVRSGMSLGQTSALEGQVLGGSSQDLVQWLGSPPCISHFHGHEWKGSHNLLLGDLCSQIVYKPRIQVMWWSSKWSSPREFKVQHSIHKWHESGSIAWVIEILAWLIWNPYITV